MKERKCVLDKPSFDLERLHKGFVVGVDEAGRGPWAGPVVVAAVVFLRYDNLPSGLENLNDSKKLSKKKREELYNLIQNGKNNWIQFSITTIDSNLIDTHNILQATLMGMKAAVDNLLVPVTHILVDGMQTPFESHLSTAIVKGDQKSMSIAAASILAKVYRDNLMIMLAEEYPEYLWNKNAGYGTKEHQRAMDMHGITPYHRKSFTPVKRFCI